MTSSDIIPAKFILLFNVRAYPIVPKETIGKSMSFPSG